jgi:uncharacterized protein YjbJ (UPF0337 family)
MNTAMLEGNWKEIKGKIKSQWAKFTDDDVDELKGDLDQLAGKIQKIYGHTKEQAEIEFNSFRKSLASSVKAAATSVIEKTDGLISAGTTTKENAETKINTAN